MTDINAGTETIMVALNKLDRDPLNVRKSYSKEGIEELAATIRGDGYRILQNLIVRNMGRPGDTPGFRIAPEQMATLRDVIAVLELRIGVETESAALAAQRRTDEDLQAMRTALDTVVQAVEDGRDAIGADFQFHLEIARATRNHHFADLMTALGSMIIPRARLEPSAALDPERLRYLRRVNAEHESIFDAIASQDPDGARAAMRTHLANSRERRRRAQAEAG